MKVLVCGGRNFNDYGKLCRMLDNLDIKPTVIVNGGAYGADTLSTMYARHHGIEVTIYRANWEAYGPSAGPRRNQEMLDKNPDIEVVIAFPGGKGTANMIKLALKQGLKVLTY